MISFFVAVTLSFRLFPLPPLIFRFHVLPLTCYSLPFSYEHVWNGNSLTKSQCRFVFLVLLYFFAAPSSLFSAAIFSRPIFQQIRIPIRCNPDFFLFSFAPDLPPVSLFFPSVCRPHFPFKRKNSRRQNCRRGNEIFLV